MPFSFNGNTPKAITYNGNDVAKLVYNGVTVWEKVVESTATLYAVSSNWKNSSANNANATEIRLPADDGYGRLSFDGHSKLGNFTKAVFHFYITANPSRVYCHVRAGSMDDPSYTTGFGGSSDGVTAYFSAKGWYEFDITEKLLALLAENPAIPTVGIKLFFTSGNNVRISTHLGEYPPYIVLE